ncbi:hypothetical protein ACC841_36615, partial [Rhizobium ruizarguesonis]
AGCLPHFSRAAHHTSIKLPRTGRFTCGERAIELQDNLPGEGEQFTRMAPTVDLSERPDAWIERCKPNHPGSR